MYIKYIVKNRHNFAVTFVVMLFLFIFLVAMLDTIDIIPFPIVKQLSVFVYAVFVVYYIIRYVLTTFSYTLIDRQFVIIKSISRYHDTPLIDIPVENILLIYRAGQKCKKKGQRKHIDNMTVSPFPGNSCIIVYKDGKFIRKMRIEYNEDLIRGLSHVIGEDKVRV